MNQHGGKRAGAGRKKGARTRKTRAIAEQAAALGLEPLEVILFAMRKAFDAGNLEKAAGYAKDAAPYCHPRLTSVEATVRHGQLDTGRLTVDQIEEALANEYLALGIAPARATALAAVAARGSDGEGEGEGGSLPN